MTSIYRVRFVVVCAKILVLEYYFLKIVQKHDENNVSQSRNSHGCQTNVRRHDTSRVLYNLVIASKLYFYCMIAKLSF